MFLYATNPSKDEFVTYTENEIIDSIRASGVNSESFLDQMLGTIMGTLGGAVSDLIYTREDYVLFSIYEIRGIDFEYKYIGIAKLFVEMNSSINSNKINSYFKDIVNLVNESEGLEEDYYVYYEFDTDGLSEIEVKFKYNNGPELEFYVIDDENFMDLKEYGFDSIKVYERQKFKAGDTFTKNYRLSKGKYYVLVDNTDQGIAYPPINFENDICYFDITIDRK